MILARLLNYGYSVSVPWGDNQKYDLLVDDGGKFIRVQCKTAWISGEGLRFNATSHTTLKGKPVSVGYLEQADVFMIYSPEKALVYTMSVTDVGKDHGFLRLTPSRYKKRRCRYADQFIFTGKLPVVAQCGAVAR